MVELRIGVDDATRADGLMRRLSALYGRSAISFDRSRNEVRIQSEWESRAVVHVFAALQAWIDEDGGKGARLSIGNRDAIPLVVNEKPARSHAASLPIKARTADSKARASHAAHAPPEVAARR